MRPVLTKKDFVRRYQAGEFGNRSPTWMTLREFMPGCHPGPFHLRNRVAGGKTFYNLDYDMTCIVWTGNGRVKCGDQHNWYVSAMAPTEHTLIQGEVQRTAKGLYVRYTRVRKPMRDALATQQDHAWGLTAKMLLAKHMDQLSFDWLGYLLDEYPDHVVEFSTYAVDFGTIPFMNTVFWEVRLY